MIPLQNWPLIALTFYFVAKLFCYIMIRPKGLSSISEKSEIEEDCIKWVPKKKHEVLKAKYKCLKKLFQIYDASFIGAAEPIEYSDDTRTKRRRKRSHRTKTDACAGTEVATDTKYDYNKTQTLSETDSEQLVTSTKSSSQQDCEFAKSNESLVKDVPILNLTVPKMAPYFAAKKPTRFQNFVQRLFGLRRDGFEFSNDAASDSVRRRKGLRYRRIRRAKKIKSEGDMNRRPMILSFVQSVQRSCLMDTTPRHCPMLGCKMISYGIINYNDHLNLCHLKDRRFYCHYCHEGFEREADKVLHENDHIGIDRLNLRLCSRNTASNCNTQTEPDLLLASDDHIKKIVSFFDRLSLDDARVKAQEGRCSETNLLNADTDTESDSKRTVSCMNMSKSKMCTPRPVESSCESPVASPGDYGSPVACYYCGETFNFRKQLTLHLDLEHRMRETKCPKFHSCVIDRTSFDKHAPGSKKLGLVPEEGRFNVLSMDNSQTPFSETASIAQTPSRMSQAKSEESLPLNYTPSSTTNVVYTATNPSRSSLASLAKMVQPYKWEPGTKVIRV